MIASAAAAAAPSGAPSSSARDARAVDRGPVADDPPGRGGATGGGGPVLGAGVAGSGLAVAGSGDRPSGSGGPAVAGSGDRPSGSGGPAVAGGAAGPSSGSGSAGRAAGSSAACVPSLGAFGYIGRDLVSCHPDGAGGHACWTIDKATGKVKPRRGEPVPGVGFYVDRDRLAKPRCFQDLCWPMSGDDTSVPLFVVYHPDGARAAIDDGGRVFVFDRASKQIVSSFVARLSNSLMGLWFVGELILVAGTDAGPYAEVEVYSVRGKHLAEYGEFFQGGLGVTSDGRAVIAEAASDTITVLNGKTGKGKPKKRRAPRPPAECEPTDPALDPSSADPKDRACLAFRARHYGPYISAVFVDSGRDLIGGTHDWLVVLDGKTLAEKSRVKLAVCPRPLDAEPR